MDGDRVFRASEYPGLFTPAVVDIFAGAGGASLGIEQAFCDAGMRDRFVDLMINHWSVAVGVHEANHPMTEHLHASVWEVDPNAVLPGRPIAYLHASPDCTHFSKARGSKPKKKEIRALAWVVVDWAGKRRPSVITLENVEEFRDWGPLGEDDQPCPRRRGQTFGEWVKALQSLGYVVQHRELRACDYGAPTTRKRLFVVARCDGKPIVWPEKTHASGVRGHHDSVAEEDQRASGVRAETATCRGRRRHRRDEGAGVTNRDSSRFARLHSDVAPKPFRTAAECIDWSIPMLSIFATPAEARAWAKQHSTGTPRRPLKPKTLERIARGLVKFVVQHPRPFIVPIENFGWGGSPRGVDEPLSTVTASPKGGKHAAVAVAPVITEVAHGDKSRAGSKGRWGESSREAGKPIGTISGSNNHAVVGATLAPYTVPNLGEREGQAPRCGSVEQPLPTITAKGNGARLVAAMVTKHYGGVVGHEADQPIGTVTGTDHHAVTVAVLRSEDESWGISAQETGSRASTIAAEVQAPVGTVSTCSTDATNAGRQSPANTTSTASASRTNPNTETNEKTETTTKPDRRDLVAAFLAVYYSQGSGKTGHSVDQPAPTIVGKDRLQLVTVLIDGQTYVITDIAMRMLTPRELARCQGFPDDYVIDRQRDGTRVTKADQVKLIGNSVPPAFMRALVRANVVDQGVLDHQPALAEVGA